jgi:putative transposase
MWRERKILMRHAGLAIFVHIVWGTWDRLPLITENVKPALYHVIGAECAAFKMEILALGGIEDHVHLLVSLPATLSLAMLMKQVKGSSAHLMTHVVAPDQFFKWQGAYGAVSLSPDDIPAVCEYIKHQPEHHAQQTLVPAWEPLQPNSAPSMPDVPSLPVAPSSLVTPSAPDLPSLSERNLTHVDAPASKGPVWPDFDD